MTFDTTQMDFNSGLFITGMKKLDTQVDICLFLNVFLSENWHICVIKGLLYLLTLRQKRRISIFAEENVRLVQHPYLLQRNRKVGEKEVKTFQRRKSPQNNVNQNSNGPQ